MRRKGIGRHGRNTSCSALVSFASLEDVRERADMFDGDRTRVEYCRKCGAFHVFIAWNWKSFGGVRVIRGYLKDRYENRTDRKPFGR